MPAVGLSAKRNTIKYFTPKTEFVLFLAGKFYLARGAETAHTRHLK